MKIAVFALTQNGCNLGAELVEKNAWDGFFKRQPQNYPDIEYQVIDGNFKDLAEAAFSTYQGIIFIMATGIVVRTLAPWIVSKDSDPAILVMDEKAKNVISLLSGHLGGANELTLFLASQLGANPVITTSTDVNKVLAFDNFAKRNHLLIDSISTIKYISDKMIHGEPIELYSDVSLTSSIKNIKIVDDFADFDSSQSGVVISFKRDIIQAARKSLVLIPPHLVLGFGCKKGKTKAEIEFAISNFLAEHQIDKRGIFSLATVEVKANEPGLLAYCQSEQIPLKIYSIDEISAVEELFDGSDFVKKTIGVKAVSEPSAYLLAGKNSIKLVGKTKCKGITLALYQKQIQLEIK